MTDACPNCGRPVGEGDRLCPACGTELTAWPPAPTNAPLEPRVLDVREIGEEVGRGFRLGCLGAFAASLVTLFLFAQVSFRLMGTDWTQVGMLSPLFRYGLPLGAIGFAYFHLRPTRPHFARGLGLSALISAAIFLGVFSVCR